MSIVVSIAAYRDPQPEPIIRGCIAKVRNPKDLHFGNCRPHGPEGLSRCPKKPVATMSMWIGARAVGDNCRA